VLSTLRGEYPTGMTEIVFAREGIVAKIIGDAIHILFGAPADQPDAATRAIDGALALDDWSQEFRRGWNETGVRLGHTRIGVHAGLAIAGNFGGGRLFDYTAYGDTINAAARLEAANGTFGTRICVSAAAAARCEVLPGFPSATLRCADAPSPCALTSPCGSPRPKLTPMRKPSLGWRPTTPPRSQPSPRSSGRDETTRWRNITCGDC
jgi:class 3 adenylate cyclase